MELMTVLIPLPRYYNPDASGMRREVEDEKFIEAANESQRFLRVEEPLGSTTPTTSNVGSGGTRGSLIGTCWRCSKQMCQTRPRTARGLKNGRRTSSSNAFSRPRFT